VKDSDFQQLLASVKEAGRIKRGEQEPARKFVATALDPSQAPTPGLAADGSRHHLADLAVDRRPP
jgi:hypothetical protein